MGVGAVGMDDREGVCNKNASSTEASRKYAGFNGSRREHLCLVVSEEALRGVGPAFGPEGIDRVEVLGNGTQGDGVAGMEGWFSTSQHGQR